MRKLILLGIVACLSTSAIAVSDNWNKIVKKTTVVSVLKIESNNQLVKN